MAKNQTNATERGEWETRKKKTKSLEITTENRKTARKWIGHFLFIFAVRSSKWDEIDIKDFDIYTHTFPRLRVNLCACVRMCVCMWIVVPFMLCTLSDETYYWWCSLHLFCDFAASTLHSSHSIREEKWKSQSSAFNGGTRAVKLNTLPNSIIVNGAILIDVLALKFMCTFANRQEIKIIANHQANLLFIITIHSASLINELQLS